MNSRQNRTNHRQVRIPLTGLTPGPAPPAGRRKPIGREQPLFTAGAGPFERSRRKRKPPYLPIAVAAGTPATVFLSMAYESVLPVTMTAE